MVTFAQQFKHYLLGRHFVVRSDHKWPQVTTVPYAGLCLPLQPTDDMAWWLWVLSQLALRLNTAGVWRPTMAVTFLTWTGKGVATWTRGGGLGLGLVCCCHDRCMPLSTADKEESGTWSPWRRSGWLNQFPHPTNTRGWGITEVWPTRGLAY